MVVSSVPNLAFNPCVVLGSMWGSSLNPMPILKNQHDESNSSKAFDICVEVFSNKLQKYGKGLVIGMSTLSISYAILNIKQKKI